MRATRTTRSLYDFERELDRFWADLLGPEERLRCNILDALQGISPAWQFVKVFANGEVRIRFHDGSVKNILPAKPAADFPADCQSNRDTRRVRARARIKF